MGKPHPSPPSLFPIKPVTPDSGTARPDESNEPSINTKSA